MSECRSRVASSQIGRRKQFIARRRLTWDAPKDFNFGSMKKTFFPQFEIIIIISIFYSILSYHTHTHTDIYKQIYIYIFFFSHSLFLFLFLFLYVEPFQVTTDQYSEQIHLGVACQLIIFTALSQSANLQNLNLVCTSQYWQPFCLTMPILTLG